MKLRALDLFCGGGGAALGPLKRLMDHYGKGYGPVINQLIVDQAIRLGLNPQEDPENV